MRDAHRVWQLVRGGELLAELMVTAGSPMAQRQVLASGRVSRTSGCRSFSMTSLQAGRPSPNPRGIASACTGRSVPEFLLHIEGEDAWWRSSDEPFPEREAEP